MTDLPEGAVPLASITITEFLDETGAHRVRDNFWTVDGSRMPLSQKLGLLEQTKIAACIPMIQSAPDMRDDA